MMSLRLTCAQYQCQRPQKPKALVKIVTQCLACSSQNLLHVDDDILCGSCDWSSCKASVESGRCDKFFSKTNRLTNHILRVLKQTEKLLTEPNQDAIVA